MSITKIPNLPNEVSKDLILTLAQRALAARDRSYAPYSHFGVGASLYVPALDLCIDGVNVENVSFGGTICAERSAISSMVSQYGKQKPTIIAVASSLAVAPCGLCLQTLVEFCEPDAIIALVKPGEITLVGRLKEFIPHSFTVF